MRVSLYWNTHKKMWSIRRGGRVVGHTKFARLTDVVFKVSPAGRLRVLSDGRKNVHAFAIGEMDEIPQAIPPEEGWEAVTYNPRRDTTFISRVTEKPVTHADRAALWVSPFGQPVLYAKEPRS